MVGLATFGPRSFGQELAAVWRLWWLFWLAWLLLGLAALGQNWIVFGLLGVGWAGCWELTGAYGSLQGLTGAWPFYTTRALKVTSATTHGVARKQHFGGLQGPGHFTQHGRLRLPLGNHERTLWPENSVSLQASFQIGVVWCRAATIASTTSFLLGAGLVGGLAFFRCRCIATGPR